MRIVAISQGPDSTTHPFYYGADGNRILQREVVRRCFETSYRWQWYAATASKRVDVYTRPRIAIRPGLRLTIATRTVDTAGRRVPLEVLVLPDGIHDAVKWSGVTIGWTIGQIQAIVRASNRDVDETELALDLAELRGIMATVRP